MQKHEFCSAQNRFAVRKALEFFRAFLRNHSDVIDNDEAFELFRKVIAPEQLVKEMSASIPERLLLELCDDGKNSKLRNITTPKSGQNGGIRNKPVKTRIPLEFELRDNVSNVILELWRRGEIRPYARKMLDGIIGNLLDSNRQPSKPSALEKRLDELQRTLQLSDFEMDVVLLLFLARSNLLSVSEKHRFDNMQRKRHAANIAKCLCCPESKVFSGVNQDSKLQKLGCIDSDFDLTSGMDDFLNGMSNDSLSSAYYKKFCGKTLPWSFFERLTEKHGEMLKKIIASGDGKHPVNILFYGEPGTGKTSFAQALAAELGRSCQMIAQSSKDKDSNESRSTRDFRFGALQICDMQAEPSQCVIVVDEADKMLRGGRGGLWALLGGGGDDSGDGGGDKGMLNSVLDSTRAPVIWIANTSAEELDASSRRRFDYSIRFDKLNSKQRLQIWQNNAGKLKLERLVGNALLEKFARQYEVSAGGISMALHNLARIKPAKAEVAATIEKLMAPHCELLGIKAEAGVLPAADYTLRGLNIRGEIPLEQIVEAVRNYRNDTGRDTGRGPDQPRMNLLLTGAPGTGKTEYVKHLGKELDAKVLVRMGSDLLSMWVGEGEKNIRRAFQQAEAEKAILFFDELDGMMQSRERAQQSWEVTQVNELLHCMENFNGVMVGATNFAANLDAAVLRRFTFKLEFDYLDNAGKAHFFEWMFKAKLGAAERARLDGIPRLAPGDFRTVRQKLHYLQAGGAENINSARLNALEEESRFKAGARGVAKQKIGF
jgi:ATPases of the AAA+ class